VRKSRFGPGAFSASGPEARRRVCACDRRWVREGVTGPGCHADWLPSRRADRRGLPWTGVSPGKPSSPELVLGFSRGSAEVPSRIPERARIFSSSAGVARATRARHGTRCDVEPRTLGQIRTAWRPSRARLDGASLSARAPASGILGIANRRLRPDSSGGPAFERGADFRQTRAGARRRATQRRSGTDDARLRSARPGRLDRYGGSP
jgi:hypothetical protein